MQRTHECRRPFLIYRWFASFCRDLAMAEGSPPTSDPDIFHLYLIVSPYSIIVKWVFHLVLSSSWYEPQRLFQIESWGFKTINLRSIDPHPNSQQMMHQNARRSEDKVMSLKMFLHFGGGKSEAEFTPQLLIDKMPFRRSPSRWEALVGQPIKKGSAPGHGSHSTGLTEPKLYLTVSVSDI